MPAKSIALTEVLEGLAEAQGGFFSASQAAGIGIRHQQLVKLAANGFLAREAWGVYRLALWPLSQHADYWRALLWTQCEEAVLSHRTALLVQGVSLANPPVIDVTVPRRKRRIVRRRPPPAVRLHFRDIKPTEVTRVDDLPVTTVYRAILDLLIDNEGRDEATSALAHHFKQNDREAGRLLTIYDADPELLDILVSERKHKIQQMSEM